MRLHKLTEKAKTRKIKLSTVFFHLFVRLSQNICTSCEQDNIPPQGIGPLKGGGGGGYRVLV